MRYITGGIALGAAAALGGLIAAGTSATGLYAPSALVLTIGQGDNAAVAGVQRAVTLTCTPKADGSHPNTRGACSQLRLAGGDFTKIVKVKEGTFCTREWNPSVVTATGVWEGRRVSFEHTFANPCELKAGKGTVFEF